jgi:hypothetical protein
MLRNEYDKVVDELEVYRKKARVAEQSWSSLKEDLQRSTEAHEKLIEIMNTELGILKKENTSLKEAHSRMINKFPYD